MCYSDQNHEIMNSELKLSLIKTILCDPDWEILNQTPGINATSPIPYTRQKEKNLNVAKVSRWTELMLRKDVATNTEQWNPSSFLEHKDSIETELYMFPYSKMKNGWVKSLYNETTIMKFSRDIISCHIYHVVHTESTILPLSNFVF